MIETFVSTGLAVVPRNTESAVGVEMVRGNPVQVIAHHILHGAKTCNAEQLSYFDSRELKRESLNNRQDDG